MRMSPCPYSVLLSSNLGARVIARGPGLDAQADLEVVFGLSRQQGIDMPNP